jgi:hydrogenase maturation factor HypF (carbamoyltransferase family)
MKPVFLGMARDRGKGVGLRVMATKFHNSMTLAVVETVKRIAKRTRVERVALSGGVLANNLGKKVASDVVTFYDDGTLMGPSALSHTTTKELRPRRRS